MFLGSCGTDDDQSTTNDDVADDDTDAKITAVVEGQQFTSFDLDEAIEAQMVLIELNGKQAYFLTIAGVDLDGTSVKAIGISFGDGDFTQLAAGKEHSGIPNDMGIEYALGTYQHENGDETLVNATSEDSENASVTVTAINKEDKVVSGVFTFTAIDPDTGDSFEVTEGKFTNIQYEVL
ncbi:hypothetical protein ULVI_13520 [Cochleicola gelatinilyticus]|uniref:Uncharacterized protein n=1 Tax=Cochleicola gelatinilyticus TaxID=1763537 RepID=A0A167F0T2_9FLAO|nr:hypothetical protein ULVI_13520 [Cochleicola gelatinilyticus]